ncbi:MAG TPA: ABC transporter ATP-binding protein [Natronincola sp.]|nr:ABC transporter ATP-binding protein [Natronincola sp.]
MSKMRLDEVSFSYGKHLALKDVSLRIKEGVFYGILGPNGAGKSTLLKLLYRYLKPSKGEVYLDERNINTYNLSTVAQKISLIPQNSFYFPSTVKEMVLLGRSPFYGRFEKPQEKDLEIVRLSMEKTGIEHLANRLVSELSGGERQRVTIARALAQQTEILLVDEPTTHLDLEHQIRISKLLLEKARAGFTSIAVLHDLNLAANYCDYIFIINDGLLVKEGIPEKVLTPSVISEIYHISIPELFHPKTGRPIISP